MSDNGLSWLEPTRNCNLSCEYCYQRHDPQSHKSLWQIESELVSMMKLRKCDAMIIAGGEPLTHPQIIEITGMVKKHGTKPVILTNGVSLTPSLVHKLKKAGVYGFIFHVDSHQNRPDWEGKSEKELNALRQGYADMVHNEGGLVCGYNTTILPETLDEVRNIVEWTIINIHKVTFNVLIPVRTAHPDDPWDYYAGSRQVILQETPYISSKRFKNLTALDICEQIWKVCPDYAFSSYLGGTVLPDAPKWLFGTHVGSSNHIYGNLGARAAEFLQVAYHFLAGRYLAFTPPKINSKARLLLPLTALDRGTRHMFQKRWKSFLKNPFLIFEKISIQNLIVMQPHDLLPNGEQDECDGCPNKTYWNGRLVSECRKEDYMLCGRPIMAVEKETSPGHGFSRRDTKDLCLFRSACRTPTDSPAAQKYNFG
ncbi:MAG: radical SAM protein [Acidobacteriota bacterium]